MIPGKMVPAQFPEEGFEEGFSTVPTNFQQRFFQEGSSKVLTSFQGGSSKVPTRV